MQLTDEHRKRVAAFAHIHRAIMNEDADAQTCLDILIVQGYRSVLAAFLETADTSTLIESIQQLAARDPEFVGRYMADILALGDDVNRREAIKRRIGFSSK